MKKFINIFLLVLLTCGVASAQTTTPRFGILKNQDNTGRVVTYAYVTPAFANTYAAVPNASETIIKMPAMTHAVTITAGVTRAYAADKLTFIFTSDTLTAGRVVTFSTGLIYSASTLTVDASQKATISFIFDGVAWIEVSRAKQ